jgi:hypothetical protein
MKAILLKVLFPFGFERKERFISTRFLTITPLWEKPKLLGGWVPTFNIQVDFGVAINWLGLRVRISKGYKGV